MTLREKLIWQRTYYENSQLYRFGEPTDRRRQTAAGRISEPATVNRRGGHRSSKARKKKKRKEKLKKQQNLRTAAKKIKAKPLQLWLSVLH